MSYNQCFSIKPYVFGPQKKCLREIIIPVENTSICLIKAELSGSVGRALDWGLERSLFETSLCLAFSKALYTLLSTRSTFEYRKLSLHN